MLRAHTHRVNRKCSRQTEGHTTAAKQSTLLTPVTPPLTVDTPGTQHSLTVDTPGTQHSLTVDTPGTQHPLTIGVLARAGTAARRAGGEAAWLLETLWRFWGELLGRVGALEVGGGVGRGGSSVVVDGGGVSG